MLSFQKQPFKISDLSQHPIKNLQSIINILTDQEDNNLADTEEAPDTSQQRKPIKHSFPSGSSKSDKGKGKDIENQSSQKNIPPANRGGGGDDNSSSDEELDQRKTWHPKPRRKIPVSQGNTLQEQNENRKRLVAKWMIKGQAKRGKPITTSKPFAGKVGEDPTSFLKNLIVDAEANGWDDTDLLEVISGFLKDDAREWFIDNCYRIQHWDEATDQRHSFMLKFVARFKTKAQVEVWHQKWDALEYEEDEEISEYTTRFKKIYKRVDPH